MLGDREWAELWVMSELLMVVWGWWWWWWWEFGWQFVKSHVLSVPVPDENGQAGLGLPPAHGNQQQHSVQPLKQHTGPIRIPVRPSTAPSGHY